jgi:hypothetical protein
MIYQTLDSVVRRYLLNRRLPIHWYIETLVHSATCLHELSIRTMAFVQTVKAEVNDYGAVEIPGDFVDGLGVFQQVDGFLKPLPKFGGLSPLRNRDSDGAFTSYDTTLSDDEVSAALPVWFWNVNDHGESTGRYFGAGGGSGAGYAVFPERREIQLYGVSDDYVVLKYVSDGNRADNATEVDTRATRTIHSFIDWQRSPNAAYKNSPEAQTFYNEERLLRAALNDSDLSDIREVIYRSFKATPKN